MKKLLVIAVFIFQLFALQSSVLASSISNINIVNSDIRAYIDGYPIRSYNINGWTGIVAEDLREYGFCVEWDSENRRLFVYKDTSAPSSVTSSYQFPKEWKQTGSPAFEVYQTDIKTYVAGEEVTAFNIGGSTIIYMDDLEAYGDVHWDALHRIISYSYREPWHISLGAESNNSFQHEVVFGATDGIQGFYGKFKKNPNGTLELLNGENLDHFSWMMLSYEKRHGGLRLGFSMIAHHLFADEQFSQLCWNMSTVRYDGERMQKNTDIANQHMQIYINGQPIKITEVTQGKGNNHEDFYFILDFDIDKEAIEEIIVSCSIQV